MNRSRFWRWRHARPFWGGLLVTLAGIWIFLTVKAPLPVVVHVGMQGFIGYLVPIMIGLCGVLLLANPTQRLFYSLIAAVLSLASWLTSNLGGFFAGLLLGLVGSALAFAWSPDKRRGPAPAETPEDGTADATEGFAGPGAHSGIAQEAMPTEHLAPAEEPEPVAAQNPLGPPGVQPETSQSRPRHRRPSPGSTSSE